MPKLNFGKNQIPPQVLPQDPEEGASKAGGTVKSSAKSAVKNAFMPKYSDVGPKPKDLRPRIKWYKAVLKERKILRKDLASRGIKKAADFEAIARDVGLSLDNGKSALMLSKGKYAAAWLASKAGLKTVMVSSGVLLSSIFAVSTLTDYKGSFTVNLTNAMAKSGYVLCADANLKRRTSRLISEELTDVSNISIQDIDKEVDMTDGPHNGANYLAYTFYILNSGEDTSSYAYTVQMDESTKHCDEAVWVMLFEDGHQLLYSAPSQEGGGEGIYGYANEPPFYDCCYDQQYQYYKEGERWGIVTTPYAEEGIVARGVVDDVTPGTAHKYTIVIWLEGYDPQCTNDIFGGFAKYSMKFSTMGEIDRGDIFSGIYRTDYDDYNAGRETQEPGPAEPPVTVHDENPSSGDADDAGTSGEVSGDAAAGSGNT